MSFTPKRLTKFCREEAGDTLRAVFTYRRDGGRLLYARDDVRSSLTPEAIEQYQEAAWEVHGVMIDQIGRVEGMGPHRVSVHTFDFGFAFQFVHSDDRGVLATFDGEIGRNPHEFITRREEKLGIEQV